MDSWLQAGCASGRWALGIRQLVEVDVLAGMAAEDVLGAGLQLRLAGAHPEQQAAAVELRLQLLTVAVADELGEHRADCRSEEHTSELQSLMRISYAVFCLKKTNKTIEA